MAGKTERAIGLKQVKLPGSDTWAFIDTVKVVYGLWKRNTNTIEGYKIKNETTKCDVLPWVESWSRKRN